METMNDPVMEHLRKVHAPTVEVSVGAGGSDGMSTWFNTWPVWRPPEPKPKRTHRREFAHLTSEQCCRIRRAVLDAEAEGVLWQVAVRGQARQYGISTELVERIVAAC